MANGFSLASFARRSRGAGSTANPRQTGQQFDIRSAAARGRRIGRPEQDVPESLREFFPGGRVAAPITTSLSALVDVTDPFTTGVRQPFPAPALLEPSRVRELEQVLGRPAAEVASERNIGQKEKSKDIPWWGKALNKAGDISRAINPLSRFVPGPRTEIGPGGSIDIDTATLDPKFNEAIGTLSQFLPAIGSLVTPGKDGPGFKQLGKGAYGSLIGTFAAPIIDQFVDPDQVPEKEIEKQVLVRGQRRGESDEDYNRVVLGAVKDSEEAVDQARREAKQRARARVVPGLVEDDFATVKNLDERMIEDGLVLGTIQTVGDIALVAGGAGSLLKLGSTGAKFAGAARTAARLSAAADSQVLRVATRPYITATKAARNVITKPAYNRSMLARGIDPATGKKVGRGALEAQDDLMGASRATSARRHPRTGRTEGELQQTLRKASEAIETGATGRVRNAAQKVADDIRRQLDEIENVVPKAPTRRRMFAQMADEGIDPLTALREIGYTGAKRAARPGIVAKALHFARGVPDPEVVENVARGTSLTAPAPSGYKAGPVTRAFGWMEEKPLRYMEAWRDAKTRARMARTSLSISTRSRAMNQAQRLARAELTKRGYSRQEADLIIGDETIARLELLKFGEEEVARRLAAAGQPDAAAKAAKWFEHIGARTSRIPSDLMTPELNAKLNNLARTFAEESDAVTRILMTSRKGVQGLEDALKDPFELTPKATKSTSAKFRKAQRLVEDARSAKQKRRIFRQKAQIKKDIADAHSRANVTEEILARLDIDEARFATEFDESRVIWPKSLRRAADRTQVYETIVRTTLDPESGGGATFNPWSGDFLQKGVSKAYIVAAAPGTARRAAVSAEAVAELTRLVDEGVIDPKFRDLPVMGPDVMDEFVRVYQDLFGFEDMSIGTWVHSGDMGQTAGRVVDVDPVNALDATRHGAKTRALNLAASLDQEAIFDMFSGEDIRVPQELRDAAREAREAADTPVNRPKTRKQILQKLPDFSAPPGTAGDMYRSGLKGARAEADLRILADRRKVVAQARDLWRGTAERLEAQLEDLTPAEIDANRMLVQSQKLFTDAARELDEPSLARTPAIWQPLYAAFREISDLVGDDPASAAALADLPQTMTGIYKLAQQYGLTPTHVRHFTPDQVRSVLRRAILIGHPQDLSKEAVSGTRKGRKTLILKGVERSVTAFTAASSDIINEIHTNALIDTIESKMAHTIRAGQKVPRGFVEWAPHRQQLRTGVQPGDVGRRVIAQGDTMIVPESVVTALKGFTADSPSNPMLKMIRKATNPWRAMVLMFSPGWYVRNFVGNAVLAQAQGVGLRDWHRAYKSLKEKDEFGRFADIPWVQTRGAALDLDFDQALPTAFSRDAGIKGMFQAFKEGQELGIPLGGIRQLQSHLSSRIIRANEVVDEFARAAVYHQGKRLNMSNEASWTRATTALVDYHNLAPIERSIIRTVFPFYAWQKGIILTTAKLGLDHPVRTRIAMLLGQMQEEYLVDFFNAAADLQGAPGLEIEDIPEWYQQFLGRRVIRSFNPFADPIDLLTTEGILRSVNPFVQALIRAGLGKPMFFPNQYRVGFFGQPEPKVDFLEEVRNSFVRAPIGRLLFPVGTAEEESLVEQLRATVIPREQDIGKLSERFLGTRQVVRGVPDPTSTQGKERALQLRALQEGPLDLQRISAANLARLPNIGPKTAKEIVRLRDKTKKPLALADLTKVEGLGRDDVSELALFLEGAPERAVFSEREQKLVAEAETIDTFDINTASEVDLTLLPGVGPSTARKIIAARNDLGKINLGDINNIKGIGPSTMVKIQNWLENPPDPLEALAQPSKIAKFIRQREDTDVTKEILNEGPSFAGDPEVDAASVAEHVVRHFNPQDAVTMVAIAMAESAGDVNAVGDEHLMTSKWGPSVGWFQIRTLNEDRGTGHQRDIDRLVSPNEQTLTAFALASSKRGWSHWTTFNEETYKAFLPLAERAVRQAIGA